jgi:hypothetical protein
VACYGFVDAGLPNPGRCWIDTVPADLAEHLQRLAADGWLPPWSQWWDEATVAELLPEPVERADFIAGCTPLPLAMFEEVHPEVPAWPDAPGTYLQLSDGYTGSTTQAAALGWPVSVLDADHLSVVTAADEVTAALVDLVECAVGR